ncbi:MAG TPA: hypothetical protein VHI51_12830 [Ktedonobacterales bacterium]|jgi:hypothetical protein|nr:hypothetical protein [Ktedonobacterales bacterium]
MRQTTDDDATARNAPTTAMNEMTEMTEMTEISGTAEVSEEPVEEPHAQPAIPAPTLRFLLHKDTPLWRFGH